MRALRWLGVVALLVVTGASAAVAQDSHLGGKIQAGDEVVVAEEETVEGDLYATAGQVRIAGTVDGDLLVAAGQVTISGVVAGDVMISAGTVDISGDVTGDARIASGQLTLAGSIGEDLFLTSGRATITTSGEIGEDLVFGNGRMIMDGSVGGDVLGGTADYNRQGSVAGEENVTVVEDEAPPTPGDRVLASVQRLISILLVAALALWLAPRFVDDPARMIKERPLASLGIGIVGLIAFVALVFLVILVAVLVSIGVALVGLGDLVAAIVFASFVTIAVLAFALYVASVFGAPTWVGMALGSTALASETTGRRWATLMIGLVVVVGLTSIPVVGGVLGILVVLFGFGGLILSLRRRRAQMSIAENAI